MAHCILSTVQHLCPLVRKFFKFSWFTDFCRKIYSQDYRTLSSNFPNDGRQTLIHALGPWKEIKFGEMMQSFLWRRTQLDRWLGPSSTQRFSYLDIKIFAVNWIFRKEALKRQIHCSPDCARIRIMQYDYLFRLTARSSCKVTKPHQFSGGFRAKFQS